MMQLSGFGNHFESETELGLLPIGQNSPQKPAGGLYAELLTGSPFTMPRNENKKLWMYRKRPSVSHGRFIKKQIPKFQSAPFSTEHTGPEGMRFGPTPYPTTDIDFIESMFTMAGCGALGQSGAAIHHYACTKSMGNSYFMNSDAETLIVPQEGDLSVSTETGLFELEVSHILVIPRGLKFKVDIKAKARGYVLENYGSPFTLPDLGPIGSSGLANTRDFFTQKASFEEGTGRSTLTNKFNGGFWEATLDDSPLDVKAWHGNYVPMQYDLKRFNTIGTVSYDHPDPSIFTVLSSPSEVPGKANVDFVIFPPRWMVAENTFRPPYYHRNLMSEYMGLIFGKYDAKEEGFLPGGSSLHNSFSAHGPEKSVFDKASKTKLSPQKIDKTLAFMFEGYHIFNLTEQAVKSEWKDQDYLSCWDGL